MKMDDLGVALFKETSKTWTCLLIATGHRVFGPPGEVPAGSRQLRVILVTDRYPPDQTFGPWWIGTWEEYPEYINILFVAEINKGW